MSRKKSKQRSNRLKRIGKRLAAYSAAAAATAVASQGGSAKAEEISWPVPDIAVGDGPGLLFNVISGETAVPADAWSNSATGSFRLACDGLAWPYIAGPAFSAAAGFVDPEGFTDVDNDYRYPTLLSASVAVGPGMTFGANSAWPSYGYYGWLDFWEGLGPGFVGLRFNIGTNMHYGWAQITNVAGENGSILHAFGYNNTPGAASHAVPEPSSIMLLAAGAAGLGLWRRKKRV